MSTSSDQKNTIQFQDSELSESFSDKRNDTRSIEELHVRAWLSQKRSKGTRRNYEREIRLFLKSFPNISLREITDKHVSVFILSKKSLSPATQNFAKNVISSLLKYCVKIRYLDFNVVDALDSIRVPQQMGYRSLTEEQVQSLLKASESLSLRDELLIKVMFYSGMRVSEVVSLKWASAFPVKKHVQLTIFGKGGKTRSILIDRDLWEQVERLKSLNNSLASSHVFIRHKEPFNVISTTTAWRAIKAAAKRAGLPHTVSPHFLRHAHAVLSLRGGATISTLQQTLGHASLSTTGIYLSSFPTESSGDFLPKFKRD